MIYSPYDKNETTTVYMILTEQFSSLNSQTDECYDVV